MTGMGWSSDFEPPEPGAPTRPSDPRPGWTTATPAQIKTGVALGVLLALSVGNFLVGQHEAAQFAESGWSARDGSRTSPTPVTAASRVPLGTPAPVAIDSGSYAFMMVQPGSEDPVTYDPCRPLPYVVNAEHAPPAGEALVAEAVQAVADVTGLQFTYEGLTDERGGSDRAEHQPERYGDRWAPLLIEWSDPAWEPGLAGDVAGLGGSTAVTTEWRGPAVFVSGGVALDAPQLVQMPYAAARAVVMHELAHVVGLDHVDDPAQLMHEQGQATEFQPGDRAGLARLGAGPCIRRL